MFSRGAERTHLWIQPAEFDVLHSFVDVKQDIAKALTFDVDDGATVSTSIVDLSLDHDGVFVVLFLLLLDRLTKFVGKGVTWSTYDGEKNMRARALTYHNCWKCSDTARQLQVEMTN